MSVILEARDLRKIYFQGKPNEVAPVDGISLSVEKGHCVVLKGPSGSGKTTLMAMLSCLTKPTSGEYWFMGEKVSRWSEKFLTRFRKQHIGIVFQQFQLVSGLSAAQNIGLPLMPENKPLQEINRAVEAIAQTVKIDHRLHFPVDVLSGGEQQRVAIARALINGPTVLFADEPTAHLDSKNASAMMDIFANLLQQGKTIVMTTHDPMIERHPMVHAIVQLKDGKLAENA